MHHHTVRRHYLVGRRSTAGEQVDILSFAVVQQGFTASAVIWALVWLFYGLGGCVIAVGDTIYCVKRSV